MKEADQDSERARNENKGTEKKRREVTTNPSCGAMGCLEEGCPC